MLALAAMASLAMGATAVLLRPLQRRLLYFPVREDLAQATAAARRLALAPWSIDGRFAGWREATPTPNADAVVLVLHGNAGSALDRQYLRQVLQAATPVDVVLLEYPGYGPRDGEPSQAALVTACREAITELRRGGTPVVIAGESLGSAVAVLAAAEQPDDVAGLLLITPLASVTAVAKRHYPFMPAWLLADEYRADLALPRYPGPVAFLVARRDEIVFADLGLELYEARTGPRWLWVEEQARHNEWPYGAHDPRWREALRFLVPGR